MLVFSDQNCFGSFMHLTSRSTNVLRTTSRSITIQYHRIECLKTPEGSFIEPLLHVLLYIWIIIVDKSRYKMIKLATVRLAG